MKIKPQEIAELRTQIQIIVESCHKLDDALKMRRFSDALQHVEDISAYAESIRSPLKIVNQIGIELDEYQTTR
jgi:hypothetical protein